MSTPSEVTTTFWDHATLWTDDYSLAGHSTDGGLARGVTRLRYKECDHYDCRPVVVIDPSETIGGALLPTWLRHHASEIARESAGGRASVADDMRYIADRIAATFVPPRPEEPTDATARVTDRRENIWRLLADGDWVCTSGPDIGEYLVWSKLTDRGPLAVEVTP